MKAKSLQKKLDPFWEWLCWSGMGAYPKQRKEIERVQKVALRIILTNNYRNYDSALKTLHTETLYQLESTFVKALLQKT